jgi:hypothetical protein
VVKRIEPVPVSPSEAFGLVVTRRVTVFAGHFGSGKTEIALNAALALKDSHKRFSLVDLDVVKPYFRSRSGKAMLEAAGVRLIAPEGDLYSADLPVILPEIRSLLRDKRESLLLDAGGDDVGTRALGSLSDAVPVEETDFFLVLNFRRTFTWDVDAAVAMARDIEATARLKVTGVISNTHLMGQTTVEVVEEGYSMALQAAARLGTRVTALAVEAGLAARLDAGAYECPVLPLERMVRPPFEALKVPKTGPLFAVG